MKRTVQITFEVDANEYYDCEDTVDGTLELVKAMFLDEADFPIAFDEINIVCEGKSIKV